jgi:hypothetical protein
VTSANQDRLAFHGHSGPATTTLSGLRCLLVTHTSPSRTLRYELPSAGNGMCDTFARLHRGQCVCLGNTVTPQSVQRVPIRGGLSSGQLDTSGPSALRSIASRPSAGHPRRA